MKSKLIYVELKSGYSDNGPAWIGSSSYSKSGFTVYFNGLALKNYRGSGISGNYYNLENGDEYWVSGVKKNGEDRHWAGSGKIRIDKNSIQEYLEVIGCEILPSNLEIAELAPSNFQSKFHNMENE